MVVELREQAAPWVAVDSTGKEGRNKAEQDEADHGVCHLSRMVSLIMNTICTVIPRKGWLAMIKHGYDIPVFWGQKYPCLWGQKYECMCYSSMPFFAQSLVARGDWLG